MYEGESVNRLDAEYSMHLALCIILSHYFEILLKRKQFLLCQDIFFIYAHFCSVQLGRSYSSR